MRDIKVLCGGYRPKDSATDVIALDLRAPIGSPERITVNISNLTTQLVASLPPRVADLLDIASYVYCADQLVLRDTPQMRERGRDWRRHLDFRIRVRDPSFWSSPEVLTQITQALSSVSEDRFAFTFEAEPKPIPSQGHLELHGDGPNAGFVPDEIVLFSGGLDSLAGALSALTSGKRVALVSHRSSTFIIGRQKELIRRLASFRAAGSLFALGINVTVGGNRARESTQRTRSFLFAAIAATVASLFGRDRISFCENGIVSLNLPLAGHVVGTRATRTTHPAILHAFSQLISLVMERGFEVVNPWFWKTKTEVVKTIADLGHGHLLPLTFSCTRVREAQKDRLHCGACSQCMDRRLGVLAAGCSSHEPSANYRIDPLLGSRRPGRETVIAEAYVMAALSYARISEAGFLSTHGEIFRAVPFLDMPAAAGARALHELHMRHGRSVTEVINDCLRQHMTLEARPLLPDSSLLSVLMAPGGLPTAFVDAAELEAPASVQAAVKPAPIIIRPITFAIDRQASRVIFSNGTVLKNDHYRLFEKLHQQFNKNIDTGRQQIDFEYTKSGRLADLLDWSEDKVRTTISRMRAILGKEFKVREGVATSPNDVIQTRLWSGYRLNPHLAYQPALLGDNGLFEGPVTTFFPSVTTHARAS